MVIREYSKVELVFSSSESEAVKIALVNLRRDLIRTLDCSVTAGGIIRILVGTVGNLPGLDKKADISKLQAEDGTYRKEAFLIQEKDGELLIAGTDRRGTIYGIYDFCEWLGVSPWYFFADERVLVDVTIKDTGIGMSEDFLKNIFQPFVQADQGARSQYKGNGLGMAIVKELLDRMGGTIQIDSVENQGTSIHVVIPFEIAEEPADVQEVSELPKENLSGCRILLAEDNELNREIAVFLLKDEGISVTEVEDGRQALECFLKMPDGYYDAVLMDIMMPVMDGYQAAMAIRGSGKQDAEMIPIIAMTANAFAEDKRKTMEAGMNAHLSKPLNVPELMNTIRKFCADKQMWQ